MWDRIKIVLQFYLRAKTIYNIQSKFAYDFIVNVLDDKMSYYAFSKIEKQRELLSKSQLIINVADFGAGSLKLKGTKRAVSSIAKNSLSSPSKSQVLFKIVNYFGIKNTLELGTSLGISSSYMALADSKNNVYTLEGDPQILSIAKKVHLALSIKNVNCYEGKFEDSLAKVLENMKTVDLAFIDGHHSEEPTIAYYGQILPYCHDKSIIILDDIHWSSGMYGAWRTIAARPEVTFSLELLDIGILFFDPKLSKQQFPYVPYLWKPWKIGLFGS